jgi:hypothetical protein
MLTKKPNTQESKLQRALYMINFVIDMDDSPWSKQLHAAVRGQLREAVHLIKDMGNGPSQRESK